MVKSRLVEDIEYRITLETNRKNDLKEDLKVVQNRESKYVLSHGIFSCNERIERLESELAQAKGN